MFLFLRDQPDRYVIRVVHPNEQKKPKNRLIRVTRGAIHKITSVLTVLMMMVMAALVSIGTAAPAHANFIEDGFKAAFCSTGLYNYDLAQKPTIGALRANTGDGNGANPTPYEKYGMSGVEYTLWSGPERQEGLDGKGEFGGSAIVQFVGGEGTTDLDKVGDGVANAKKNEATQAFPGFYNTKQTCVPVMDVGSTAIANAITMGTKNVVGLTNMFYQVAYESSSNIMTVLEEHITTIVVSLRDAVFFEFLTPIIMISALWMAWTGLVKRSSIQATQGALWMILSAVAAVALMTNPMSIPKAANTIVSTVSEVSMKPLSSAGATDAEDALCQVEDGGDATRNQVRMFQCVMWENFLYVPWVMGQFGENPRGASEDSHLRQGWTDAQGAGSINGQPYIAPVRPVTFNVEGGAPAPTAAQNWALYQLDNKVKTEGQPAGKDLGQQRALINVAIAQLHKDNYNGTYKGEGSMDRIGTATLAFFGSVGAATFVTVIAFSIIVLDIYLIMMMVLTPFVFLLGVHPGFGRKIAMGWVETVIGVTMKRIALSIFLSLIILLYTMAFQVGGTNWWLAMIMLIAFTIVGFKLKKQIVSLFDKINFNGGANNQIPEKKQDGKPSAGKKALAVGMGVAGGGLWAAASGAGTAVRLNQKKGVAAVASRTANAASSGAGARPQAHDVVTPSVAPTGRNWGDHGSDATAQPKVYASVPSPVVTGSPAEDKAEEKAEANALPTPVAPAYVPTPAPVFNEAAVAQDLKKAGYRRTIGVGAVSKAAMRGAVVGAMTGSPKAAMFAGIGTISQENRTLKQRNETAVSTVSGEFNAKAAAVEKANAQAQAAANRKANEAKREAEKAQAQAQAAANREANEAKREAEKARKAAEDAAAKEARDAAKAAERAAEKVRKENDRNIQKARNMAVKKSGGTLSEPVRKTIPRPAPQPTLPAPRCKLPPPRPKN